MGLFKTLGNIGKGVAKVAAPVVLTAVQPEALINTALAGVAKHAVGKLPNDAIPYLNLLGSTAVRYAQHVPDKGWEGALMPALQEGGLLAGLSTAIHQSVKLPTKHHMRLRGQTL